MHEWHDEDDNDGQYWKVMRMLFIYIYIYIAFCIMMGIVHYSKRRILIKYIEYFWTRKRYWRVDTSVCVFVQYSYIEFPGLPRL
jgi:hypothetical protein